MKRELLACGLTVDGQLGMRPNNDYGTVKLPEHIIGGPNDPNGSSVVSVACGEKHTLLLANDGKVWSVGGNDHGQLGRGSSVAPQGSFTIYPVNLTGTKIIQITCGRAHSFAVAEDGRLFGWGSNEHGQLAQANHIKNHNTPKRIHQISEVVQVACGPEHCICLCESGRVFVWGQKWDGANIHEPHEVVELHGIPIVRIEAGGMHCMALSASGRVFAWGQNEYGQLGNNDTRPSTTPVRVEAVDNMKVVDIAAGYSHSVLLTKDGRVFAFGSDQFGQLGLGRKLDRRSTPQVVQELMGSHTSRIACGRCHTMAVIAGKLYSFGLNTSGQLGNGLERNQISPRLADENLDHVAGIFAGWDQTFLIRQGGVFDVNSAPSAPIKYPKFLTGAKIHDLVAKHEKLDLMEMLESVFSSLSCINGSFLFNDDRRFMTNCSGIDLDSVMDSFNLLSSSSDRQLFAELIMNSAEMSIFCEDYPPNKYFSIECVRAFLILPWLDAFVVNVTAETVQGLHLPFAKLLGQLKLEKNGYWKTLEKWWAGLATRHFKRLVSAMMAAARVAVREKWSPYQILPVMSVLDHLSQMNKIYNAIPIDSFYLHELNDTVDLLNDYATWRTDPNKRSWCWSNHPYLLNGIAKVDILRVEASLTQHAVVNRNTINFLGVRIHTQLPYFGIEVRREFILDDTLNQLISTPQIDLMKPLKVKFHGEEGEDAGGIKKEFFMILFQKMLSEEYGMFEEDSESHLKWFQGLPLDDPQADTCFELTGKLCAMAIYNDVLVNLPFPLALYKLLLGQKPVLEDLTELYPTTGKGLDALLNYEDNDFEEIFGLTFTVDYKFMDRTVTEELKPHGAQTSVTKENKHEYVKLFVQHKLEIGMKGRIAKEMELFRRGFEMLISGETMQLFQPRELQEMVIGNENYDWTEFKKVVKYKSEYHINHPTILTFWEAFFRLTLDERKKFMQFLMGSPRLPVKGISALDISIQPCADHLLPAAHTCANLLDLPKIVDPDEMLRRLRISIQHAEGFTLV